jgi:tetratricopeptide (TPR) repeat protein
VITAAQSEQRAASRSKLLFKVVLCSLFALLCSLPYAWAEGPGDQHFQAGLAYERLGRYDESYTELQLAFAVNQDNAGLALALGLVASRLGRLEVAQRALERSIAIDADSEASYYQVALLYEKKGSNDRATDAWHRFLSLSPDEALKAVAEKHIQYLESHHS